MASRRATVREMTRVSFIIVSPLFHTLNQAQLFSSVPHPSPPVAQRAMGHPSAIWQCTDSRPHNMLDHQSVYHRKRSESVLIARVLTTSRDLLSDNSKNLTMEMKFPERNHAGGGPHICNDQKTYLATPVLLIT
jgi:hypothetical protein